MITDVASIAELERHAGRDVVDLARAVCLAVRVDALLLRRARLWLVPLATAATEADLWFSELVRFEGAEGFVLRDDVAATLRRSLATPANLASLRAGGGPLHVARMLVEEAHRHLPALLRKEEELIFLAVADAPRAQIERELRSVLRTILDQPRRTGVAAWVARALPGMPEGLAVLPVAQVLALAAARRTTEGSDEGDPAPLTLTDDWRSLLTRMSDGAVGLGLELFTDHLEIHEPARSGAVALDVPDTNPLAIEVSWSAAGDEPSAAGRLHRLVEVPRGGTVTLSVGHGDLRVRTYDSEWSVDVTAEQPEGRTVAAMGEDDWYSLTSAIAEAQCILMIGPDAVTGLLGGRRLSAPTALAAYLKQRLGSRADHLDETSLVSVAQYALDVEDRATINHWLEDFVSVAFEVDALPLADLAALPFPLVVTSGPGPLVLEAFRRHKPGTSGAWYDRAAHATRDVSSGFADAPLVYDLLGSTERAWSSALTTADQIELFASIVRSAPGLPVRLNSEVRDRARTLLLVGFEVQSEFVQAALHVLLQPGPRDYRSYAVEPEGVADPEVDAYYQAQHRIRIVRTRMEDFARELRTRTERMPPSGETAAPGSIAADAPIVFLCHASEDRQVAQRIAVELQSAGIATKVDEDLPAGVAWNEAIARMISEEVHYVVVLQSANLIATEVGEVNREIKLALDRQSRYRPPRRFLIPAIIDDPSSLLNELSGWQSVDLTDQRGVEQLVRVITRDLDLARPAEQRRK